MAGIYGKPTDIRCHDFCNDLWKKRRFSRITSETPTLHKVFYRYLENNPKVLPKSVMETWLMKQRPRITSKAGTSYDGDHPRMQRGVP